MTGTGINLVGLRKQFGVTTAVDGLNLEVAAGSLAALLGPSGCGKSTTLAMINGLLEPDVGDVHLDGRSVLGTPAQRRPIATVFQKPLLFPHLDVWHNVAFGLRMRRVERRQLRRRVDLALDQVQLTGLAHRRVGELSGGQEQRVSLARALVLEPRVLLLDEPFSQLDAALRAEMRSLVRQLHHLSDVTTLFVTHDQGEAVDIADTVALMVDGTLAGHGSPEMFYRRPPSLAAARFFGVTNEVPGDVVGGTFLSRANRLVRTDVGVAAGPAVLVVRPEALRLASTAGPATVGGMLIGARFAGTHTAVDVALDDGGTLQVSCPVGDSIQVGARVHVEVPPASYTIFPVAQS